MRDALRIAVTGMRLMMAAMAIVISRTALRLIGFAIIVAAPIACLWTGVRIGEWFELGTWGTGGFFLAGMVLYVSVKNQVYRRVVRFHNHVNRRLIAWERRINAESSSL